MAMVAELSICCEEPSLQQQLEQQQDAAAAKAAAQQAQQEQQAAALREALAGASEESLKLMGERIAKSQSAAERALVDLRGEQEELRQEREQLQGTIEFFMRELRKLNITAANLTEPKLAGEGTAEFVARLWEKMRPRDNAYCISEQVGELRAKPGSPKASPLNQLRGQMAGRLISLSGTIGQVTTNIVGTSDQIRAQEISAQLTARGAQLSARGRQAAERFSSFYSSFEKATGLPPLAPEKSGKKGKKSKGGKKGGKGKHQDAEASEEGERAEQATPGRASPFQRPRMVQKQLSQETRKLQAELAKQFEDAWSMLSSAAATAAADGFMASKPGAEDTFASADKAAEGGASPAARPAPPKRSPSSNAVGTLLGYLRSASFGQDSGAKAAKPQNDDDDASPSSGSSTAATSAPASREPSSEDSPKAAVDSTLLIQVKLTLGDGSMQLLQVRAEDRCKEVATRFVKENSLKGWFEAPLKNYLMEAESNATRFPVMLEADLLEIRKQYNASKA